MKRTIFAIAVSCATLIIAMPGHAASILKNLTPGDYEGTLNGCDSIGDAGTMYFDGKNFSGHYMICRTVAGPNKSGKFVSKCVEAQGDDYQRLYKTDITKDPDVTTNTRTLNIINSKKFKLNRYTYKYCDNAK